MNFLQVSTCVNGFSFCLVDDEGLDFFLYLLRDQDFFLVCFFFSLNYMKFRGELEHIQYLRCFLSLDFFQLRSLIGVNVKALRDQQSPCIVWIK